MTAPKEPHIYTPAHDPGRMCPTCGRGGRPFENYQDQPDTASRMRLDVYRIPFALPERRTFTDGCLTIEAPADIKPDDQIEIQVTVTPFALPEKKTNG